MKILFQKKDPRAIAPTYGTAAAAGADLYACPAEGDELSVAPGETVPVHTGLCVCIPDGHVGLIFARSGLSVRQGLAPANKVGVIDADYRGEIIVALYNQSRETRVVRRGDRVAQLVVLPVPACTFEEADELPATDRGEGGFGSTGR